jgi:hypothetical protein
MAQDEREARAGGKIEYESREGKRKEPERR